MCVYELHVYMTMFLFSMCVHCQVCVTRFLFMSALRNTLGFLACSLVPASHILTAALGGLPEPPGTDRKL